MLEPLGKLYNIIIFIMVSPRRIQAFTQQSKRQMPQRDSKTGWNSWFTMLHCSPTKICASFFFKERETMAEDLLIGSNLEFV